MKLKQKKLLNILTWTSTVITAVLWTPVLIYALFQLKKGLGNSQDFISIGIIGGADGPTSVFVGTALVAGIGDWVLLIGMLAASFGLWCYKIRNKK